MTTNMTATCKRTQQKSQNHTGIHPAQPMMSVLGNYCPLQTSKDIALFAGKQLPDQEVMAVGGPSAFDAFGRTVVQYYTVTEPKGNTGVPNNDIDNVAPHQMTYDVIDRMLTTTLPDEAVEKM